MDISEILGELIGSKINRDLKKVPICMLKDHKKIKEMFEDYNTEQRSSRDKIKQLEDMISDSKREFFKQIESELIAQKLITQDMVREVIAGYAVDDDVLFIKIPKDKSE